MARILVCAFALVACSSASSAPPAVHLAAPPPAGLVAGKPWAARLVVRGEGRPAFVVRRATTTRTFATRAAGRGRFDVRVVFPRSGTWTMSARLRGRVFPLGRAIVGEPSPATI